MTDVKFIMVLLGFIGILGFCNNKKDMIENFWGVSAPRTVKVMREVQMPDGRGYSLQNNYANMLGGDKFVSTPSFQGTLSPRFSNVDYGAQIRYNLPSAKNRAAPINPLTFGHMVKENYTPVGCRSSANSIVAPTSQSASYTSALSNVYKNSPMMSDSVEVGDMETLQNDGTIIQPIVYDRYIYANQKSRLRGQGDPIRGDLPIVPCNNGWFNPSVTPNVDLHEGAMNVLAGPDNGTARALGKLNFIASGGAQTINSGVNMASQYTTSTGGALGDIRVSSFA